MGRIFHFINRSDLDVYLQSGELRLPSLDSEGFIHCSTIEQVIPVANFLAPYDEEMELLEIDEEKVVAEIKYENFERGEQLFPHIYGPLNEDAIVAVHHLDWDGEEGYLLPEVLQAGLNI